MCLGNLLSAQAILPPPGTQGQAHMGGQNNQSSDPSVSTSPQLDDQGQMRKHSGLAHSFLPSFNKYLQVICACQTSCWALGLVNKP